MPVLFVLLMAGCGGGGGGGRVVVVDSGITVAGRVNGLPASSSRRNASVKGETSIAGTLVELYTIDGDGNSNQGALAAATTDNSGKYKLVMPAWVNPGSEVIVSVGAGAQRMRAFVISETADIDPVSELLVETVAANNYPLSNFTPGEISEMLAGLRRDSDEIDISGSLTVEVAKNVLNTGDLKKNLEMNIKAARLSGVNLSCGNGIKEGAETCDEGEAQGAVSCSPDYEKPCSYCDDICRERELTGPFCGDGIVNGPEECDDGGVSPGDGCSETCSIETAAAVGECGNGTVEEGEECDDGAGNTEDCAYGKISCLTCDDSCMIIQGQASYCGDGAIDSVADEECDDGNAISGDGCSFKCKNEVVVDCYTSKDCDSSKPYCVNGGSETSVCVICAKALDCNDNDPLTSDSCDSPGSSEALCLNVICTPACNSDADCDDSDISTVDACVNVGTCLAVCDNTTCDIECASNEGCDDGNALTIDSCANPGTCSSGCGNTSCEPVCSSDADCDDSNDLTDDICSYPGTCGATCQSAYCGVECSTDDDCEDGNALTNQLVLQSGRMRGGMRERPVQSGVRR